MRMLLASAAALTLLATGPTFAAEQPGSANQSNLNSPADGTTPKPLGHSTHPTDMSMQDEAPMKHHGMRHHERATSAKKSNSDEVAETERLNDQELAKAGKQ
ncbi:MAG TPA: hypothetical protein VM689_01610 [Aliidongia sp.]|nr:hypothetical protein [Aliidongia sp.]